MSKINDKLGLKPAGARARLNSLSGVKCPHCPHRHVISNAIHGRLTWACGACGHTWEPSDADITAYNGRVRSQDRIAV